MQELTDTRTEPVDERRTRKWALGRRRASVMHDPGRRSHTFIADVDVFRSGDELHNLGSRLAAERTSQVFALQHMRFRFGR